ncbi:MAG TPA: 16S rRNA (cytidine(1402)-2'-O)-methyltransferase [Bdellovibrionota bacterium]|nr:16S rRNA (cytidine(1402)-2'-O)-methyltransferase [Bdellovibrionota bacterium]
MPSAGRLYVVATPIGNLGDITGRAQRTLAEVEVVAAEDTRRTRQLLSHLGLSKKLLRCDEAKEAEAAETILPILAEGRSVALATDAGTPSLSDPGHRLVDRVLRAGYTVVPIPGPSAVTTLLSVCGFSIRDFHFYGFLPKKSGQRRKLLEYITTAAGASVFFEAPHRISRVLAELAELSGSRMACVGRELTKIHEEILRGSLTDVAAAFSSRSPRGEFTVVIAPSTKEEIRSRRREQRSTMAE